MLNIEPWESSTAHEKTDLGCLWSTTLDIGNLPDRNPWGALGQSVCKMTLTHGHKDEGEVKDKERMFELTF
jgi:hypothetical protein